jgi:nicotinamidase-related amidase
VQPTQPTVHVKCTSVLVDAAPAPIALDLRRAAVLLIDMQRDFLEPGGFGEVLGNDVSRLAGARRGCRRLLDAARRAGLLVVHTREGHRPDLSDAPPAKLARGAPRMRIGDRGPMGRILVRGEPGHEIVADLAPRAGEPVVDKPGKGAFHATDLHAILLHHRVEALVVGGVTTEVCVHTTVREANDRGYRCLVLGDCCGSYFPEFHEIGLRMIQAQGGILGWVSDAPRFLAALDGAVRSNPSHDEESHAHVQP